MKLTHIFTAITTIATLIGCHTNGEGQQNINEPTVISHNNNQEVAENTTIEDCDANNLAQFIAGKDNIKYAEIQNSDFYREYSKRVQQQWEDLTIKSINPVKDWCKTNIPDFHNDSTCLFYPFGGPDVIFAMTFFPVAQDYILFGLENPGHLCNPDELAETNLHRYLDSLSYSFRYLNRFGFFIAGQMRDNFKNVELDGTVHLALYSLAMQNCTITDYKEIYLDDHGTIQPLNGKATKHPYGWEIKFKSEGDSRTRSVKYFRFDASDDMMTGHLEFPFYLNSIKEKVCYLKSASYLLQGVEFKVMQKLVTDQCSKILQDESGLAYGHLLKNYDIKLFGTYTRPLKVFSIFKQDDLKNAITAQNSKALPFKIGYASQLNETVLMACTKKSDTQPQNTVAANTNNINNNTTTTSKPQNTNSNEIVYRIQFKVSWKKIDKSSPEFKGIKNIDYYTDNSSYKYVVGNFKTEQECAPLLKEIHAKGFTDAFIVKFRNGQRIK